LSDVARNPLFTDPAPLNPFVSVNAFAAGHTFSCLVEKQNLTQKEREKNRKKNHLKKGEKKNQGKSAKCHIENYKKNGKTQKKEMDKKEMDKKDFFLK